MSEFLQESGPNIRSVSVMVLCVCVLNIKFVRTDSIYILYFLPLFMSYFYTSVALVTYFLDEAHPVVRLLRKGPWIEYFLSSGTFEKNYFSKVLILARLFCLM